MKDKLFDYCGGVRSFLELRWQQKHLTGEEKIPKVLSTLMCRYTSIFLQQVLATDLKIKTIIVGGRPIRELQGTPRGKYGFVDCQNCWYDHCWLETKHLIIDLTADQFGDSPIIITPKRDGRYRANLDEFDPQFRYAIVKLLRVSDRWFQMWRANSLNSACKTLAGFILQDPNDSLSGQRSPFSGENEAVTQEIGQTLHEIGGFELMLTVATELVPPCDQKELELLWHGIGEWKA